MENIDVQLELKGNFEKKVQTTEKSVDKLRGSLINVRKQLTGITKIPKGKTFEELQQKAKQLQVTISEKNRALANSRKKYKEASKAINTFNKNVENTGANLTPLERFLNQGFRKARQPLLQFNGDLLSLMFLGMALRSVFQGALTSIFNGYKDIIPENSKFNREMTKLTANWEFFKFQLADAFVQSKVFDVLINGANILLKYFQNFTPETQKWVVYILLVGTALAGILTWVSLLGLGLASWINVFKTVKIKVASIVPWFVYLVNLVKRMKSAEFWKGLLTNIKSGAINVALKLVNWAKTIVTNIANWFKNIGNVGIWNSIKSMLRAITTGFGKNIINLIKGIGSFFKIGPIGWIIVAIQSLFETFQSIGERTFDNFALKAIGTLVSLIINLIENIIELVASLVDMIVNALAWVFEQAGAWFDWDFNIPKLNTAGMVDRIGDSAEDWVLDLISTKRTEQDAARAQNKTEVILVDTKEQALEAAGLNLTMDDIYGMAGAGNSTRF